MPHGCIDLLDDAEPAPRAGDAPAIDDDDELAEPAWAAPGARPRPNCPLDLPVLVVNRYFQPVQVTSARRAFLLLYGGSALAVDESGDLHDFSAWRLLPVREHDDEVSIVGGALRVPRVLHLRRYERMRRPSIRLTRRNLMLRDTHQCQYCGRTPPVRDLNIDHVLPRSRGGEDTWENLVTACRTCNLRKGWRTPDEAKMSLLRKPTRPRWSTSTQILLGAAHPFVEWEPFLKAG
ncbi:MAG TPA: HNH endonuclease [Minicystis sp.]|nr:HNH endonuclease [Minicystis sp.]